ncbi:MAG: hypothetical protein ACOC8E_07325, partial [Planctomycetota bacterium]
QVAEDLHFLIEADAGDYPSWRKQNEFEDQFLKNIIKVRADNLTIRGVGGRAHLAYKCRGPDSKHRWTIRPHGTQHGSVIVQAARNLRLEKVEVSGGCEATNCTRGTRNSACGSTRRSGSMRSRCGSSTTAG